MRTLLHLLSRWPLGVAYNYADYMTLGREHRSGELMMQGYLRAWRALPLSVKEGSRLASVDLVWLMQLEAQYSNSKVHENVNYAAGWIQGKLKDDILPDVEWTLKPEFEWMWKKVGVFCMDSRAYEYYANAQWPRS